MVVKKNKKPSYVMRPDRSGMWVIVHVYIGVTFRYSGLLNKLIRKGHVI